jgi:hypothetical protein
MPETQRELKQDAYETPQIADYGDLVEKTAAGATGGRVDATYTYGQTAGFLSTTGP